MSISSSIRLSSAMDMAPVIRGRGGAIRSGGISPSSLECQLCHLACSQISDPLAKQACHIACDQTICQW